MNTVSMQETLSVLCHNGHESIGRTKQSEEVASRLKLQSQAIQMFLARTCVDIRFLPHAFQLSKSNLMHQIAMRIFEPGTTPIASRDH